MGQLLLPFDTEPFEPKPITQNYIHQGFSYEDIEKELIDYLDQNFIDRDSFEHCVFKRKSPNSYPNLTITHLEKRFGMKQKASQIIQDRYPNLSELSDAAINDAVWRMYEEREKNANSLREIYYKFTARYFQKIGKSDWVAYVGQNFKQYRITGCGFVSDMFSSVCSEFHIQNETEVDFIGPDKILRKVDVMIANRFASNCKVTVKDRTNDCCMPIHFIKVLNCSKSIVDNMIAKKDLIITYDPKEFDRLRGLNIPVLKVAEGLRAIKDLLGDTSSGI